ncbi:hypothetical protein PMNALOAF_1280 [Methylobacterium adhaesivum]|jgi:hypothetical protein|uniref:Uncharacterized protein n=1 Tax=Methylobacterium adhaesivum TaxID=333297 RepID=A0ABT8BJH8_9HYPH|nr:hypothetical protein [Methylobacterium adhaesivum]MDN3591353.1 hypothetical protein [Methylobacterium adhaesivum]GJD30037.1 hypothetical protein PMNALOAF_1280 [Methylobacterium adhaesivum]
MAYFVDIMPARTGGAGGDHDRPTFRLPERFDDLEDAAEFALAHLEERGWLLTEWSFNVVEEAGRIILTADEPAP